MKVADERHGDAPFEQPLLDVGDGGGRLIAIDRDAYEFGAGAGQRRHLSRRRFHIGRIRIGHRLHDDRRPAAHRDAANLNRDGLVTLRCIHLTLTRPIWPRNHVPHSTRDCSEFRWLMGNPFRAAVGRGFLVLGGVCRLFETVRQAP